jgi:uncharacterized protein (DUF342 family)
MSGIPGNYEDYTIDNISARSKLVKWLFEQGEKAKMAWSVAAVLAALFGYSLSVEPVSIDEIDSVQERLELIQQNLDEITKTQVLNREMKVEKLKKEIEEDDKEHREKYKKLLDSLGD